MQPVFRCFCRARSHRSERSMSIGRSRFGEFPMHFWLRGHASLTGD